MAAAITGLSAILLTSAAAFTAVKWLGALYLIYLGVSAFRNSGTQDVTSTKRLSGSSPWSIFWQGFVSDMLNPKVAMFFLALLPQFVEPGTGNPIGQLFLMGITVTSIGLIVNFTLITVSAHVTNEWRQSTTNARWLKRAMGVTFIGLGARLALEKA